MGQLIIIGISKNPNLNYDFQYYSAIGCSVINKKYFYISLFLFRLRIPKDQSYCYQGVKYSTF